MPLNIGSVHRFLNALTSITLINPNKNSFCFKLLSLYNFNPTKRNKDTKILIPLSGCSDKSSTPCQKSVKIPVDHVIQLCQVCVWKCRLLIFKLGWSISLALLIRRGSWGVLIGRIRWRSLKLGWKNTLSTTCTCVPLILAVFCHNVFQTIISSTYQYKIFWFQIY